MLVYWRVIIKYLNDALKWMFILLVESLWKLLFVATISNWLVVWNMAFMTFHSVGNAIIPTDELIFFRGVETTNRIIK